MPFTNPKSFQVSNNPAKSLLPSTTKRTSRCELKAVAIKTPSLEEPMQGHHPKSVSNSIPLRWATLKLLKTQT